MTTGHSPAALVSDAVIARIAALRERLNRGHGEHREAEADVTPGSEAIGLWADVPPKRTELTRLDEALNILAEERDKQRRRADHASSRHRSEHDQSGSSVTPDSDPPRPIADQPTMTCE